MRTGWRTTAWRSRTTATRRRPGRSARVPGSMRGDPHPSAPPVPTAPASRRRRARPVGRMASWAGNRGRGESARRAQCAKNLGSFVDADSAFGGGLSADDFCNTPNRRQMVHGCGSYGGSRGSGASPAVVAAAELMAATVMARVTLPGVHVMFPGVPLAAVVPAVPPAARSRRPGRDLRGGSGLGGGPQVHGDAPNTPWSPDPPQSFSRPPHHGPGRCSYVTRGPRAPRGCRGGVSLPPCHPGSRCISPRPGTGSSFQQSAPMAHRDRKGQDTPDPPHRRPHASRVTWQLLGSAPGSGPPSPQEGQPVTRQTRPHYLIGALRVTPPPAGRHSASHEHETPRNHVHRRHRPPKTPATKDISTPQPLKRPQRSPPDTPTPIYEPHLGANRGECAGTARPCSTRPPGETPPRTHPPPHARFT
jgi:hypothetical protein